MNLSLIQSVYAAGNNVDKVVNLPKLGIDSLADAFGIAINIVLGAGLALTIIFLILGGIQYMTAKGDQKAATEARNALTNAVVGFIVVIGAFTIKKVLETITGANSTNSVNGVINLQ